MKKETENGSVAVEATIVIPVFLIAVFLVINWINIFMVHNRIQYAINSSAHELASYSYIYSALNIDDAVNTIKSDGASYTSKIDSTSNQILDCLDKIQSFSSVEDVSGVRESGEKTYESVKDLLSDPNGLLAGSIYIGVEGAIYSAQSSAATHVIQGFTEKYLEQGDMSADDYLKNYGIKEGYSGLDFSGTSMMNDSDGMLIDVVVQYDIDLSMFTLVLSSPEIHMVQRVSVPAWLDGDGKSPKSYGIGK
jgi:hypothetical protein